MLYVRSWRTRWMVIKCLVLWVLGLRHISNWLASSCGCSRGSWFGRNWLGCVSNADCRVYIWWIVSLRFICQGMSTFSLLGLHVLITVSCRFFEHFFKFLQVYCFTSCYARVLIHSGLGFMTISKSHEYYRLYHKYLKHGSTEILAIVGRSY